MVTAKKGTIHIPGRPESCSRLTAAERVSTVAASPISHPTKGIKLTNITFRMMAGTAIAAQNHQNSDRIARPSKLVRLSKPDLTAS